MILIKNNSVELTSCVNRHKKEWKKCTTVINQTIEDVVTKEIYDMQILNVRSTK